jgi:hypothetical protein
MNYTKWDVLRGLNLPHRILEAVKGTDRTPAGRTPEQEKEFQILKAEREKK